MDVLSSLLLTLHRQGREQDYTGFQEWALELIGTKLHFDSAIWGLGNAQGNSLDIHCVHLYKQSSELMMDWEKIKKEDILVERATARMGVTAILSAEKDLDNCGVLRAHAQRHGIAHAMCTIQRDPVTALIHFISLYRADPAQAFQEDERMLKQCLMPHLVETCDLARIRYVQTAHTGATDRRLAAGLADLRGVLISSEYEFTRLLQSEWPNWQGPRMPLSLETLFAEGFRKRFYGKSIVMHAIPMQDQLFLRARKIHMVDHLSPREFQVARQFGEGFSYKEIARLLDISPATVRNHLSNVYNKLQIADKAELSRLLSALIMN